MKMMKQQALLLILLLSCVSSQIFAKQITVGWLEEVSLGQQELDIRAKLDTGADSSSINAVNVVSYEKDGKPWVKFTITNRHGQNMVIDKPVVRIAKVKNKYGGRQERPVIEVNICIAGISKLSRVSLVDRSHFKYQVLIGRSFLKPEFIIDSSKEYTTKPKCQ